MKRLIVVLAIFATTACSSGTPSTSVPSLNGIDAGTPGAHASAASRPRVGYSTTRVEQLHEAAQCLREHGVPNYQDPVLTADGHVFTDARSVQDAGAELSRSDQDAMFGAIREACGQLFTAAGLQPDDESPAPTSLVQAGVRAAQCLRGNGLPQMRDPTVDSPFTPGHGFAMSDDELPNNGALGKQDPAVQRAFEACRTLLDAEIRASTLTSLADD